MTARPSFDPVPPFCRDVLDLFRGPFAAVRFPDVDRERLESEEHALLAAQAEVEEAERALDAARQRTKEAAQRLSVSAQQALAYARVFALGLAEGEREAIQGALDAIREPRTQPPSAARPRKPRPRRGEPSELLPIEADRAAE